MAHDILKVFCDALGRAIVVAESLRVELLRPYEDARPGEFVGGRYRVVRANDQVTGMRAVAQEVASKQGPSAALSAVEDALDSLRMLLRDHNAEQWMPQRIEALRTEIENRHRAVVDAVGRCDGVFDAWTETLPDRPVQVGVCIADRWYLPVRDVARLMGSKDDAARKFLGRHVPGHYTFGKLHYWDRDDLLQALHREKVGPGGSDTAADADLLAPPGVPSARRRKKGKGA